MKRMESTPEQSSALPSWLAERQLTDDCAHEFSVVRDVDIKDLPPYVKGPVQERYCSKCGEKETLRHRLAAATSLVDAPPAPQAVPAPPRATRRNNLPNPVPLDQIHVKLDLDRFGKRYDRDRAKGVVDRAINVGPDPRWNDAMAAAAEQYVAAALGVHFPGDNEKPDKGWDMSFGGRRVQAKWTRYDNGKLISSPTQTNVADYYVLVTGGSTDQFRIAGWATLKELKSSTTDLGYGITFAIPQERLRPFEDLLAIRLDAV